LGAFPFFLLGAYSCYTHSLKAEVALINIHFYLYTTYKYSIRLSNPLSPLTLPTWELLLPTRSPLLIPFSTSRISNQQPHHHTNNTTCQTPNKAQTHLWRTRFLDHGEYTGRRRRRIAHNTALSRWFTRPPLKRTELLFRGSSRGNIIQQSSCGNGTASNWRGNGHCRGLRKKLYDWRTKFGCKIVIY
jgi:hypothetical protein